MEELKKEEEHKKEEYTCFYCPENGSCPFAWDDYNLEGDCLAEKQEEVMHILTEGHILDQHRFGITTVYQVEYEEKVYYIAVEHGKVVYFMEDD